MSHSNHLSALLVNDERIQYDIVRDLLTEIQIDVQVDWADSAGVGREKMLNHAYDVCLIDYAIGKENGIELLREMTATGYRTPIGGR